MNWEVQHKSPWKQIGFVPHHLLWCRQRHILILCMGNEEGNKLNISTSGFGMVWKKNSLHRFLEAFGVDSYLFLKFSVLMTAELSFVYCFPRILLSKQKETEGKRKVQGNMQLSQGNITVRVLICSNFCLLSCSWFEEKLISVGIKILLKNKTGKKNFNTVNSSV